MKPFKYDVWVAFGFTVALSAIAMVTLVATGNSGAWIPAFVGFLPMSFFFTAVANGKTREQVRALEARLAQLETGLPGSASDPPASGCSSQRGQLEPYVIHSWC